MGNRRPHDLPVRPRIAGVGAHGRALLQYSAVLDVSGADELTAGHAPMPDEAMSKRFVSRSPTPLQVHRRESDGRCGHPAWGPREDDCRERGGGRRLGDRVEPAMFS